MRPAALILLPLACLLPACGIFNPPETGPSDTALNPISLGIPPSDGSGGEPTPEPSRPHRVEADSIIIHPLTRVGADVNGTPAIILHLDIRDRFGQSIKAFGTVRAQLLTHGSTFAGSTDEDGRIWDVDLRTPRTNALMYDDLVTRTYTIPLGGLPDWLIAWSREQHADEPTAPAPDRPDLRVWFTLPASSGGKSLSATRRLDP